MDGKDRIIAELRELNANLTAQLERQAARIAALELALAKAKKDSSTSSKPPSSDIVTPKPKQKKPGRRKKRKRGGQPGHQQQLRAPLPPERVDETIDYEIDDGEVRRLGLTPTGDFDVIQHIELPDTPVHVTEYRLAVYQDADGNIYIPDCPELKGPIFGPRLLAMIGWLKSVGHCSYSTLEAWMEDVLQVPVSRGYLAKLCTGTISASLADAYGELTEAIPRQEQLGSDETSIKDNGKRHWIWCITAATFSLEESSQTGRYDLSQDSFRFMFAEELEPTNNHSEQQIRHCVIDRRITQGTRGEAGQRYHERMWSAIATCKKQDRNFFDFLLNSIAAQLNRTSAPSLLNA